MFTITITKTACDVNFSAWNSGSEVRLAKKEKC